MKFRYGYPPLHREKAFKKILGAAGLLLVVAMHGLAQGAATPTPRQLAQAQLEAYNAKDLGQFLATYADSVAVYTFPDQLQYRGIENMRQRYADFFVRAPRVHCEVTARVVHGNTVIDHEKLTGFADGQVRYAVAIYVVERGKIQRVYFVRE